MGYPANLPPICRRKSELRPRVFKEETSPNPAHPVQTSSPARPIYAGMLHAAQGGLHVSPLNRQIHSLAKSGMTRFFRQLFEDFPDLLMKDVTVEATRPIGPCGSMGSGCITSAPIASSASTSIRW